MSASAMRFTPWAKPLATASGATAFLLMYRGAPTAFDEWLALPIAIETALPGTYPAGDLLVHGSMQGPFYVYKLASLLWTYGFNADVAWYVLLVLSLVAFFLAAWRVGGAIGLTDTERAMLLLAIAATPVYRGTLHWSAQPMLSFITASVAVPLGLLAVAAALELRPTRALVCAALAFDVHPSIGLCAGIAVLSVSAWRQPIRVLLRAGIFAAAVAAPNVAYLLRHPPGASAESDASLWAIFRIFGYHTFVRDYWGDYPWYALALALALVGAAQLGSDAARRGRTIVVVLTIVAAGWIAIMNLTTATAVMPLYLIRASLLVKPLVVGLALTALTRRRYAGKYAFVAPFVAVVAVAHPQRVLAEAALAILLGIVLQHSPKQRLSVAGTGAWTCGLLLLLTYVARQVPLLYWVADLAMPLRWMTIVLGVVTSGLLLFTPPVGEGTVRTRQAWATLPFALSLPIASAFMSEPFGRGWLPEYPAKMSEQIHLSRPLPKESGAMRWAAMVSPPGSLFAVPPVDQNWLRFRVATHRGVYGTVHDVNQLTYVRNFVFRAVERLAVLGVIVRSPHNVDPRPYLRPTCSRLQRLARDGVGYYVLPPESVVPTGAVIVYRDVIYSILDVKRSVEGCAAPNVGPGPATGRTTIPSVVRGAGSENARRPVEGD